MSQSPGLPQGDIGERPSADSEPPTDQSEPSVVPGLVDGTELAGEFVGTGYREPPQLVFRPDGQVVNLPPVLYRIVEILDHQRQPGHEPEDREQALSQLVGIISQATGREFTEEHIGYLFDTKLAPLGITTYSDGSEPALTKARPMLALRFRAAVFPPEVTWVIGGIFAWLYRPTIMVLGVLASLAAEAWAFGAQDMGGALQEVLLIPSGVAMVIILSVASTAFHEFGHAAACRYGGVPPGTMGCGIYLVWPVFYTDVTSAYRLGRSGRLRTDLGGVYFNGLFVIGLSALYLWTGMAPFLVAIMATNLEMIRQLLPTLRFDGYYIVADLVGIPDLFKYIRPIFKRVILRQPPDDLLHALKRWPQRVVAVWVLVVVPVLLAQLTFIAVQIPTFFKAAWQRGISISEDLATGNLDAVEMAVSCFHILMLVLPVAGLFMIVALISRGAFRLARQSASRSAT